MNLWGNVHEETRGDYTIRLSFAPEDHAPDWDMTDEERDELLRKIDAGLLLWFVARVEAIREGITLGVDYLGGCCYESVDEFIQPGGYFEDMVDEAVNEAETIRRRICA